MDDWIRTILEPLLTAPTGPFHEERIAAVIVDVAQRLRLDCERDPYGNLLVRYRRGSPRGSISWMAHMDHPAVETAVDPPRTPASARGRSGRMLGGVTPRYLRGAPVRVLHADGVETRTTIASVPRSTWEKEHRVRFRDPVDASPGTLAVFDLPGFRRSGNRIRARQCDDIAGVGAILMAMAELVRSRVHAEVWGLFTRAEEVGFIGATALARSGVLAPDQPVVSVECSSVRPHVPMGRGFVVRTGDRVLSFDPMVVRALSVVAEDLTREHPRFRHQRALMDGGACEASTLIALGYPTAAVCLPLGNYHNMAANGRIAPEIIDARDLAGLVAFIVAAARARPRFERVLADLRGRFDKRRAAYIDRLRPPGGRGRGETA